ncbi:ABC-2 transporter permease [Salsuginibacillus kocurii]|uniref:ABC-2 transporter permease n=1 Tax=Salsuginibacillus kocurii TaxID=427078 RepID=UPI00037CE7E0|nr:ABC-2 transporter permease [Salsuginibacillus kocurii]
MTTMMKRYLYLLRDIWIIILIGAILYVALMSWFLTQEATEAFWGVSGLFILIFGYALTGHALRREDESGMSKRNSLLPITATEVINAKLAVGFMLLFSLCSFVLLTFFVVQLVVADLPMAWEDSLSMLHWSFLVTGTYIFIAITLGSQSGILAASGTINLFVVIGFVLAVFSPQFIGSFPNEWWYISNWGSLLFFGLIWAGSYILALQQAKKRQPGKKGKQLMTGFWALTTVALAAWFSVQYAHATSIYGNATTDFQNAILVDKTISIDEEEGEAHYAAEIKWEGDLKRLVATEQVELAGSWIGRPDLPTTNRTDASADIPLQDIEKVDEGRYQLELKETIEDSQMLEVRLQQADDYEDDFYINAHVHSGVGMMGGSIYEP